MTVNDRMRSIVRTLVPTLVAWLISQLPVLQPVADDLGELLVLIILFVYYGGLRLLEERYPWVGVLLGWKGSPMYLGSGASGEYLHR